MKIKEKLMHKYALSPQGASDMLKAFVSVTVSDLVLMIPVSLLYFIVKDYMEGTLQGKGGFYIAGIIVTLALIAITTYIQYNATFLSTYVESGVRRITLAEKLRKIPLSFFGKKDLSDLTSTIMADCAQMETASSHFYSGTGGSMHFYSNRCSGNVLFQLENGIGSSLGASGFISYCRLFGKSSEKSESEADGIKNGMCGRDSGVPGKCKRSSCI